MINYETACFTVCAVPHGIVADLKYLNAEAVQLAALIKKNFEELGV